VQNQSTKTCLVCQNQFKPHKRTFNRQKYCSNVCNWKNKSEKLKKARQQRLSIPKKCHYCQKQFNPCRKSHKYCSKECQTVVWKENNKEKLLNSYKDWYKDNRKRKQHTNRKYSENNKEKIRILRRKWFFRKLQDIEFQQYWNKRCLARFHYRKHLPTLLEKASYQCQLRIRCSGTLPDDPKDITIDHIIPVSLGGTDHLDNLQIACKSCNSTKGNKLQFV